MKTTSETDGITSFRDPLQPSETAYEILGIACGAERAEIEAAFKRSFQKPGAVEARRILLDGTRRARHDLTLYNADVLRDLNPSPVLDETVLSRPHRGSTVSLWEGHFKREFPNVGLAHALAVQWYWWAVLEEERLSALAKAAGQKRGAPSNGLTPKDLLKHLCAGGSRECKPADGRNCPNQECEWRGDCMSSAPALPEMWERAIAYWCMVERSAILGHKLSLLGAGDAGALVTEFVDSLEHHLLDQTREFAVLAGGGKGDTGDDVSHPLIDDYRSLVLKLRMERRTAEAVAKAGVRTKRGKVCCGVLLLRDVDMLAAVRKQVQTTLDRAPTDERLQELNSALSPYSGIVLHLEAKEPRAALAAIDKLPRKQRGEEEVTRLRVRALHLLGKELASLGETQEAIETWGEALGPADALGAGDRFRTEISKLALAESRRLRQYQRDEAIDLLELALGLVADEGMEASLGDLLCQRGINRFLRGREQAEGVPGQVQTLLNQANSAAGRDDWDSAIKSLRKALEMAPGDEGKKSAKKKGLAECREGISDLERAAELGSTRAKEQLQAARNVFEEVTSDWRERCRKNLAVCLGNRGIGLANRVLEGIAGAAKSHDAAAKKLIASLSQFTGPTQCGYPGCYSTPQFTVTLTGGTVVSLCASHSAQLKAQLSAPKPAASSIQKLQEAEDNLLEALELDPSNSHVRGNLESAQDLLKQFGASTKKQSSRYRSPRQAAKEEKKRTQAARQTARREAKKRTPAARQPAPRAAKARPQARRQPARRTAAAKRPAARPQARGAKRMAVEADTSGFAIACIVLGVLSLFLGPIVGVPALYCGHTALSQIRKAGGALRGTNMAKIGLAVSYAALLVWGAVLLAKAVNGG